MAKVGAKCGLSILVGSRHQIVPGIYIGKLLNYSIPLNVLVED